MSGWGEGYVVHEVERVRGKRLDPGESGPDLEDVDGLDVAYVRHRHHNPKRFIDRPEVWEVSRLECAGGQCRARGNIVCMHSEGYPVPGVDGTNCPSV